MARWQRRPLRRRPEGSRHLTDAPRHQGRSAVRPETVDDTFRPLADVDLSDATMRAIVEAALADDRARIARSVNDTVIRRLFGLGLALEGIAARVTPTPLAESLQDAVEELDAAIADVRTAVCGLSSVPEPECR